MKGNTEIDQLDALLAQPAEFSDQGFSERVALRASRQFGMRRRLFVATGVCWVLLMFVAGSPQAIFADISRIGQSLNIGGVYSFVLEQVQAALASPEQLLYATIATAILSVTAVISMAVRA